MSGINTTIEWMTRQRALTSIAVGLCIRRSAGRRPLDLHHHRHRRPQPTGSCAAGCDQLPVFRSIVIYNSLFSLVVTSPLAFLSGRYVSDQLHVGRTQCVFFALVASLGMFCLIALAIVVPFYLFATTLNGPDTIRRHPERFPDRRFLAADPVPWRDQGPQCHVGRLRRQRAVDDPARQSAIGPASYGAAHCIQRELCHHRCDSDRHPRPQVRQPHRAGCGRAEIRALEMGAAHGRACLCRRDFGPTR